MPRACLQARGASFGASHAIKDGIGLSGAGLVGIPAHNGGHIPPHSHQLLHVVEAEAQELPLQPAQVVFLHPDQQIMSTAKVPARKDANMLRANVVWQTQISACAWLSAAAHRGSSGRGISTPARSISPSASMRIHADLSLFMAIRCCTIRRLSLQSLRISPLR